MIGIFIMFLSFIVLMVASMWVIYEKAGKPGWTSIVPIYNYFIFLEIIGKPWWWFLLSGVPIVNIVFLIWGFNLLSKSFGKTEGFTVGLLFIPVIFVPILAFGEDVEYKGPAGN